MPHAPARPSAHQAPEAIPKRDPMPDQFSRLARPRRHVLTERHYAIYRPPDSSVTNLRGSPSIGAHPVPTKLNLLRTGGTSQSSTSRGYLSVEVSVEFRGRERV